MADRVDDMAKAAVRAWATVAHAWMNTANEIMVSWWDLPNVESGRSGFNEEVVWVPAQRAPAALHPGRFADLDDHELPPKAVRVVPSRVGAGEDTKVRVRVRMIGPRDDMASGTYVGSLLDSPGGTPLVDEIGVYVVGGRAP
jgi:hypothetical protein